MNIRDLKVGEYITVLNMYSDRGNKYLVVTNHIDDVLFLWNDEKDKGYHIFYDNESDLKFVKFKFDLEV